MRDDLTDQPPNYVEIVRLAGLRLDLSEDTSTMDELAWNEHLSSSPGTAA